MCKFSGSLKIGRIIFLAILNLSASLSFARETVFTAQVISVYDGDTIRVQDQNGQKHRIRLAYIDAPELNQTGGQYSRQSLARLLVRQMVQIEVFDVDKYRRQVARVSLGNVDINLQQIEQGNAWHYRNIARKHQNRLDFQRYEQAENHAKSERLGLWYQHDAQAPWTFRYQNRNRAHSYSIDEIR